MNGEIAGLPFGGSKRLGSGREQAKDATDLYTQSKWVWMKL